MFSFSPPSDPTDAFSPYLSHLLVPDSSPSMNCNGQVQFEHSLVLVVRWILLVEVFVTIDMSFYINTFVVYASIVCSNE